MDHVFLHLWAFLQVSASFSSCVLTWGTRGFLFSQISSFPLSLPNISASSAYSQKFPLFPNCSLVEFSAPSLLFSSLAPVLRAGSSCWADPAPEEWKGCHSAQGPCQTPSLLLRFCKGKKNQLMPQKPNTRTLWGGSLLLESKENVSTATAGIKEISPLGKTGVSPYNVQTIPPGNLQHSPDAAAPACEEWRALLWTCNGQKCLTFHFKHQASEVLKIPLSGKTPPKSLASIPFLKWIAATNLH